MTPSSLARQSGRRSYTCTPCRTRKIRCDRQRHCGQCSKKSIPCVWPENGDPIDDPVALPSVPGPSRSTTTSYGTSVPSIRTSSPPVQVYTSPRPMADVASHTSGPVAELPRTVALAEQLDHSILNNNTSSSSASFERYLVQSSNRYPFAWVSGTLPANDPFRGIPRKELADVLLITYLDRVEWIHHPLHLPTFVSQYNRMCEMTETERIRSIEPRWLALLYIVLCLGAHFGDHDSRQEAELLKMCEQCLSLCDFINEPSLEAIQAIICLNIYYNNNDRACAARSLLGVAIRMALTLGLSRLPADANLRGDAAIEREIGRRLWWSLVCQDAYTASTNGFTYSINVGHSSTARLADVEDDAIGSTPDPTRPTMSTYHLAKIDFALVVRDFIDAVNADFPNIHYTAILRLDAQFRQVFQSLPTCLRHDIPQPIEFGAAGTRRYLITQRIFMGITLHNRLLRLHRGYMARGYCEADYRYSTDCCISSAMILLDLAEQCKETLCRWWVVLVHIWTAGLVLGADLVRETSTGPHQAERRRYLMTAISLLEPQEKKSPVAHRGLRVLRSFLRTPPTTVAHQEPFGFQTTTQTLGQGQSNSEVFPEWATVIDQTSTQAGNNGTNWNALFELDFDDLASLQWPIDLGQET